MKEFKEKSINLKKAHIRKQMYLYLSNSFAYPEQKLVDEIISGNYFNDLQDWIIGLEINIDNKEYFLNMFKNIPEEQVADTLKIEYTRLFINTSGSSLLVPPFESCYKNKEGLVMNKETVSGVVKSYKKAGLVFPDDFDLLPDHVAVELEFMSYLTEREYIYWENNDPEKAWEIIKQEIDFLEKHLISWVPEILEKIKKYSDNFFYKNLAEITNIFLLKEMDYINENREYLEKMEV